LSYKKIKQVNKINFLLLNFQLESNLVVVNAMRTHPYNNSIRPTAQNNNNNAKTTTNPTSLDTSSPFPGASGSNRQQSSANLFKQPGDATTTTKQVNQNNNSSSSSSNAILAQLKSLGPNFKSTFMRPRHSRRIDPSLILDKKSYSASNRRDSDASQNRSILNMLYSNNNSSNNNRNTGNSIFDYNSNSSLIMKILPSIEPKELHLNQSVDDLLKKFATENDTLLSRTIKSIGAGGGASSSSRGASMSPASTRSCSPVSYTTTIQQQQQQLIQQSLAHKSGPSSSSASLSHQNRQRSERSHHQKWTCMVCLSKHTTHVDVCGICGSSRPIAADTW
jgi:hypothetical protein